MALGDKITVVIDVVTKSATAGLKDFKSAVGEAQGFTGKLKAGVGSLADTFSAAINSPAGMATAVAAVGTAAFQAASAAMDLGLAVGDLSDKTGLGAEQASRWLEVTGDLGIQSSDLANVLNKLNKNIDPAKFDDLGVSIARTASGTVDANQTFLNVIDRLHGITDPAERATVATQLLGKNWQSVSELISKGADDVDQSLKAVGDEKVFSGQDVADARAMRDSFAELEDAVGAVAAELGKSLIPIAKAAADTLLFVARNGKKAFDAISGSGKFVQASRDVKELKEALGELSQAFFDSAYAKEHDIESFADLESELSLGGVKFEEVMKAVQDLNDAYAASAEKIVKLGDEYGGAKRAAGLLADEQRRIAESTNLVEESTNKARDALKRLQDQIKGRNDLVNLVVNLGNYKTELDGITMKHAAGLITDREYWLQAAQLTGDAQSEVADYVSTLDSIPDSVKTRIIASFDPNAPDKFLNDLQAAVDGHVIRVGVVPGAPQAGKPQDGPNTDPQPADSPTDPKKPKPRRGIDDPTQESLGTLTRSSAPVNITVNAPVGANMAEAGRQVADALRAYYANGGERP